MDYIMVPVPEELVPEVKQFLQWNTVRSTEGTLPEDAAARFVDSLDDVARRFLIVVADAAVEVKVLSASMVAEAVGCSEREVLGLMMTLNISVQSFGTLPWGLIHRGMVDGSADANGVPDYTIHMRADVGATILSAARGRLMEI